MDDQFAVVLDAIRTESCEQDIKAFEDVIIDNYNNLMMYAKAQ